LFLEILELLSTAQVTTDTVKLWWIFFHLPAGFPALEIPESSILAHGGNPPVEKREPAAADGA